MANVSRYFYIFGKLKFCFREMSRNFPGKFREISGTKSRIFPGNFRGPINFLIFLPPGTDGRPSRDGPRDPGTPDFLIYYRPATNKNLGFSRKSYEHQRKQRLTNEHLRTLGSLTGTRPGP